MNKRHEIIIRAVSGMGESSDVQVRCSCGVFILDRSGEPAEVSLIEITQLVAAHYVQAAHPETGNGSTKLIKGRK